MPCLLPSVAVNDLAFRNGVENNWSGRSDGLTYWRAILALERYGYEKLVTQLGKKFSTPSVAANCSSCSSSSPLLAHPAPIPQKSRSLWPR